MSDATDARRLRIDDEATRDEATRLPAPAPVGAVSLVCNVTTGTANAYCTCQPQTVTGTETTGTAGTLTSSGDAIIALNLGAGNPTGKNVVLTFVDHRFVFRYD